MSEVVSLNSSVCGELTLGGTVGDISWNLPPQPIRNPDHHSPDDSIGQERGYRKNYLLRKKFYARNTIRSKIPGKHYLKFADFQ